MSHLSIFDKKYAKMGLLHQDTTDQIIKAFYNVYNKLGYGFLEKVYENAIMIELTKMGIPCEKQVPIDVYYESEHIGKYYADLLVNNQVIVELKAASGLLKEHEAQLLNYLKATEIEVGLLLNFGVKPQISRKIFENKFK